MERNRLRQYIQLNFTIAVFTARVDINVLSYTIIVKNEMDIIFHELPSVRYICMEYPYDMCVFRIFIKKERILPIECE